MPIKKEHNDNKNQKKIQPIPLAQEYIEYHEKYSSIYGESTIVFMQVGGFYEAYATQEKGPDLLILSKLIGVIRTRKDKSINEITLTNPYFLGFPINAITKYIEILLENDYVIVLIDQTGNKKDPSGKIKGEERKVTNIYSRGTYIDNLDKKDGNYMMCIYLSNENSLLSAGMSAIDVSTGHVFIHEAFSSKFDESFALDEIDRFIATFSPKETIIYYDINKKQTVIKNKIIDSEEKNVKQKYSKDYIISYLKLNDETIRFYENVDKKYNNYIFQNEIFSLVYSDSQTVISPIEFLDFEKSIYSNTALCLAFDFIYNKNSSLISNLIKPVWFSNTKKLLLGNNAIRQLDIIETSNNEKNKCKYRSLFHVVNQTSTAMGERFLKHRLLSPSIDPYELNNTYNQIESMMINDYYKTIETFLDNIKDIERLQRKIELCSIRPMELPILVSSYENILELIANIKEQQNEIIKTLLPSEEQTNCILNFIKHMETIFISNELDKYTNYDFTTCIFNEGIHEELDNLHNNVSSAYNKVEEFRDHLDNLIKTTSTKCIHIKKNDKDGYYLSLSNLNATKLKTKLDKLKVLKIGKTIVDASSLKFKEATKVSKITIPSLNLESEEETEDYEKQFSDLNKKYFFKELSNIAEIFSTLFKSVTQFVAKIDFLKSSAKVAKMYNYVKPVIKTQNSTKKTKSSSNENSFINVTNLRHPIIERLIDHEYIPHSLELGKDLKGMMLFGINSAGKSSMMKAIGLSVVLAQSGLYVPAERFEYYPYNSLYTRITGDDNIFRGLSSFTLEMVEVNAILKRSSKNTLVIGDEVCRGTEHISGNALVASAILKLAKTGSSFIFATHLHEIMQIKKIQNLTNVKAFHLDVSYDEKTGSLIYDRNLKEGSGNQLYGIAVAQFIIQDKEFIDTAIEIKNDLLDIHDSMVGSGKTSNYNKNVIVYKCNVCGARDKKMCVAFLETHHIEFQKDCVNGFVANKNKTHVKKDQESNLTILCQDCHNAVHAGKIKLNGYKMTSKGKTLIINTSNNENLTSHV